MLTKEAILAADDLPFEIVDVPEWGDAVRIRGLNCADRDEYLTRITAAKKGDQWDIRGLKVRLAQMTVMNGDGGLMFSAAEVEALGRKSATAIDRIYDVAMRLSGLTADEAETAEVMGKSESGGSSGSGTN